MAIYIMYIARLIYKGKHSLRKIADCSEYLGDINFIPIIGVQIRNRLAKPMSFSNEYLGKIRVLGKL